MHLVVISFKGHSEAFQVKNGISELSVVRRVKRRLGLTGRPCRTVRYGGHYMSLLFGGKKSRERLDIERRPLDHLTAPFPFE